MVQTTTSSRYTKEAMILYTEEQLQIAYVKYVRELYTLKETGLDLGIPSLEEFRPMYEEQMEFEYGNDFLQ
tara:strand:+ start:290 stop:502 length:213 start_codon:yes stop_codon:yes gene_type:complete